MRLGVLLASLLVLPLAGCFSNDESGSSGNGDDDGTGVTRDVWAPVQEMMAGVPCEADVGDGQSSNLVQLANVSYGALEETGIHGELDIRGDLALHARYDQGGFEIVNISDPLAPVFLGAYDYNAEDNGNSFDVKFSPDNMTALYGAGSEIHMVDIRDPLHPVAAGEWSLDSVELAVPAGGTGHTHMLATARIAEQDWVFIAPNANNGLYILRMTGPPEARELEFVAQTLPVEGGPIGPHDMFVGQDTQDGNWYVYSADGFHGWTVFNINDPTSPEVAGGMANPVEGAYTHSIQAEWVNGRRLVVTIGEVGANAMKVYDATQMRAPILLAIWQAEPGPGSAAPEHNFNLVGGKAYLSYYTLGMYIFDLTQLSGIPVVGSAELTPVGHFGTNPEQAPGPLDFTGIWDTLLKDGIIYLSDIEGGLVVVGYGCNGPFPNSALTSTG